MTLEERIIFVDGEAIVIDKPAGLPVDAPRAGGPSIEARIEELCLNFARPPVAMHRLDTDTSGCLLFARNAAGAIEVERALHEEFIADFGLSDEEVQAMPAAPTNLAYTSYLLAVVGGGSFAEGLGALLPCFWIYREVGRELIERGSPDPLYGRWIETYGGEEYGAIVEDVIVLTDRIAAEAGEGERLRMREHFVQTSRYEWMFWDMGYRREAWPV